MGKYRLTDVSSADAIIASVIAQKEAQLQQQVVDQSPGPYYLDPQLVAQITFLKRSLGV